MKTCITCGEMKPEEQFEIRDPETGKRRGQCMDCRRAARRASKLRHRPVVVKQPRSLIELPTWGGPVSPGALVWRV